MDDGPPRKKSRFFSAGKSKIGALLPKRRKSPEKEERLEAGGQDTSSFTVSTDVRSIPLASDLPDVTTSTNLQLPSGSPQVSATILPNRAAFQHLPFNRHHVNDATTAPTGWLRSPQDATSPPCPPQQNVAATEKVITRTPQASKSPSPEAPARDPRRHGIIGIENLAPVVFKDGQHLSPRSAQPAATFGNNSLSNIGFRASGQAIAAADAPVQSPGLVTPHGKSDAVRVVAEHSRRSQAPSPTTPTPSQTNLPVPPGHPFYNLLKSHSQPPPPIPAQHADVNSQTADQTERPILQRPQTIVATPDPTKQSITTFSDEGIDQDRDFDGDLLDLQPRAKHRLMDTGQPIHLRPIANPSGPRLLPRNPAIPSNLYTSPNRIANARLYSMHKLKRKRPLPVLPPPAYIYTRSNSGTFSIFNAILLYPELVFALAAHLTVDNLASLYAISKDFHTILDTRFTTVVLTQARRKAPESAATYPFRAYAHLCRQDPAARIPHPDRAKRRANVARQVPSLRWLRMVLHREKVVAELLAVMAEDGVPVPSRCGLALKKMWFILDVPDNARRIGFVHARRWLGDLDLYFAICAFVKMDMRANDPVAVIGRTHARRMMWSLGSLTQVLRVLKREVWRSRVDVMRAWVEWRGEVSAEERETGGVRSVFGVPVERVGKGCLEYGGRLTEAQMGRKAEMLLRPDQLVIREAVRRGLRLNRHYMRCLCHGYVDDATMESYGPRDKGRRIGLLESEGEYGVDDVVGGVECLGEDDEGFDELLDLGGRKDVSLKCVRPWEGLQGREKEKRVAEEEFLDRCMEWMEVEKAEMGQTDEDVDVDVQT